MAELSPVELARARHRLYGLLGQLLALGDVDACRDAIEALPALHPLLEAGAEEHHRWLSHELSAHASAFVDGTLEGPTTASVRATYRAIGFAPGRRDLLPDHLGLQLAAMAHLCAMHAEALVDGAPVAPVEELCARMLRHLLQWVPLVDHAVGGPWACATSLALELLQSHGVPAPAPPPPPAELSAGALLVPCAVGWVCTWEALHAVSEAADRPVGFGSKRRALAALLDDPDARQLLADRIADAPAGWEQRAGETAERVRAWG
jgi:hypothetical protein